MSDLEQPDGDSYDVTVRGVTLSHGVEQAARQGLARVRTPIDTMIVFTDSFVDDVRHAIGSTAYQADRGSGVVAAKTIQLPTGGAEILVNMKEAGWLTTPEMERLLAHEGGHALLYSRDESMSVERQSLVDHEWQWRMMCLGGHAAEEFRIEKGLYELGFRPAVTVIGNEHVEDSLAHLNSEVVLTLLDPDDTTPQTMARRIFAAHSSTATLLAYLTAYAGHPDAADPTSLSARAARHWRDYIGPLWQERRRLYERLPDMFHAAESQGYDATLLALYGLEMKQLQRIGFDRSGSDLTSKFVRVATTSRCEERLAAAQDDLGEQP